MRGLATTGTHTNTLQTYGDIRRKPLKLYGKSIIMANAS
jgi:hypothetical protein